MKQIFKLLFFLFLLSFPLQGQEIVLNKVIADIDTKLPLKSVTVFNDKDNSITNEEGVFVFVSSKNEINFSAIGYNDIKTTFDLLISKDTVFMERKAIVLDEVIVNNASAYMRKVYDNINVNYPIEPYGENFFLRCLLKKNEAIVRLQDISGKAYRERLFRTKEKKNSVYTIEIVNMRKTGISETNDATNFQFQSFKQTLDRTSAILLNVEDKYSFTEVISTDPDYRKINFIAKEKTEKGQVADGYFIINRRDYAIKEVFIDEYSDANSVPYVEKGIYKWRTTFFQSLVQYAKNNENNKYYVSNAKINGNVEVLKNNLEVIIYDFTTDLFITNSFIAEKVKSNFSEDKDIFKAKSSYSKEFWDNQNQLPLTSELNAFLKKVSEDKNKKEFEVVGNF